MERLSSASETIDSRMKTRRATMWISLGFGGGTVYLDDPDVHHLVAQVAVHIDAVVSLDGFESEPGAFGDAGAFGVPRIDPYLQPTRFQRVDRETRDVADGFLRVAMAFMTLANPVADHEFADLPIRGVQTR